MRAYLGGLTPMPASGGGRRGAATWIQLEPRALTRALFTLGRRQLAHTLVSGSPRAVALLAARLPWGQTLVSEVAAVSALGDGAERRLGRRAACAARVAGVEWSDPLALGRVGARALAPWLGAEPDLAVQLSQRLPRSLGLALRRELVATDEVIPTEDAPSAAELAHAIARATVGRP